MLFLYLVTRKATARSVGYDEYDSFVVAAATEQDARRTAPNGQPWDDYTPYSWVNPEETQAKLIGVADGSLSPGVVCASFNAG